MAKKTITTCDGCGIDLGGGCVSFRVDLKSYDPFADCPAVIDLCRGCCGLQMESFVNRKSPSEREVWLKGLSALQRDLNA